MDRNVSRIGIIINVSLFLASQQRLYWNTWRKVDIATFFQEWTALQPACIYLIHSTYPRVYTNSDKPNSQEIDVTKKMRNSDHHLLQKPHVTALMLTEYVNVNIVGILW